MEKYYTALMSFGPVIRFFILKFFEKTFKLGFPNKTHRFFVSNPRKILYFNRYLERVMVVDYEGKNIIPRSCHLGQL